MATDTQDEGTATATIITRDLEGFAGDATLYRCEPPLAGHGYVIASAANVMMSGPETYVFPADADGKVTDWGELPCSERGELDRDAALERAGYRVVAP